MRVLFQLRDPEPGPAGYAMNQLDLGGAAFYQLSLFFYLFKRIDAEPF
jgi:hypothetical protein